NAVHHKPSSFLSDSYILGDLATADSILAISEQPHGGKPLIKTDGGVFAKASDLNGKFAFEVMTGASPGASLCTKFNFGRPATGASDYAIRPAPDGQIVDAVVGIREVQDCFLQALWFAHKCLVHCLNSSSKQWSSQVNNCPNLDSSLRRLREHGWEPTFPKVLGPTMQRKPVIFMRRRQSGVGRVFDLILEDIATRVDFPAALLQIVGLAGAVQNDLQTDPSSLSLGNEDENVLLSKPANKEQLEIARQLARRDCVIVQGPPGTGKTHTIANLLGHLLAQGKSVLVTAHTPKALRVLRQKVVEPLQPLCISVLQNDKQSQDELRQSVRLIHVGLSKDDRLLEREAEKLRRLRARMIGQLQEDRSRVLDARQD